MLGRDAAPSGSTNFRRGCHADDSRVKRGVASPLIWVVSAKQPYHFFLLALTEQRPPVFLRAFVPSCEIFFLG